jgi:hypothetical protein
MSSTQKHGILVLAIIAVALLIGGEGSLAQVPTGTPVFSDPTEFDNEYFPFEPGGMKVYTGKSDGEKIAVVDVYREDTRTIDWNGTLVTCVILQETEFEDGELAEISYNYFAQANDGSVYYFGEIVDNYDDGEIEDHEGSWLVGGPVGDDPAETEDEDDPMLFVPGNPEVGDQFAPEFDELATIKSLSRKVKVIADKYEDCMQMEETEDDGTKEMKYYAPEVGLIKEKGKGESLKLIATSFAEDE